MADSYKRSRWVGEGRTEEGAEAWRHTRLAYKNPICEAVAPSTERDGYIALGLSHIEHFIRSSLRSSLKARSDDARAAAADTMVLDAVRTTSECMRFGREPQAIKAGGADARMRAIVSGSETIIRESTVRKRSRFD
ncbi:unnamed protein product, partial [Iphiclides podalirius]